MSEPDWRVVRDCIGERIRMGVLVPGDQVPEGDLADEWGVPGEVVTMAARQLADDGRVTAGPDGFHVA